ncbi:DUF6730 family protein [Maribacter luteus]|uniref:DUF6730 family protein n=1 Tax=Maribacter luteus TaxID=2594478 RepID=UPI00248F6727|nr:DUF6730 family protein [Maribacter luteus]
MNKLETITQLLVNELTDFETNVDRLEKSIERVERAKVQFDVSSIKDLTIELKVFQNREIDSRKQYLTQLDRKLENAKIYPKWAVVTFIIAIGTALSCLYFAYGVQSNMQENEQKAYQQGIKDYEKYLDSFFEDNPKAFGTYKKWKEKQ